MTSLEDVVGKDFGSCDDGTKEEWKKEEPKER